jgi:hypothetical protein
MPNGDMVMPNYDEFNNIEFMQKFGNILKQSFTISPLGIRKTVCAPVFDILVPLMFIELINISLPIKNTEPSSACVSLLVR